MLGALASRLYMAVSSIALRMERDSSSNVLGAILLFMLCVPPIATFIYQSDIDFERQCCVSAIRKYLCACFDATCGKCLVACFKAPQAIAYPRSVDANTVCATVAGPAGMSAGGVLPVGHPSSVQHSHIEIDLQGMERPSSRSKPAPPEWSPSAGTAPPALPSTALPPPTAAPLPIATPVLPVAVPSGNAPEAVD